MNCNICDRLLVDFIVISGFWHGNCPSCNNWLELSPTEEEIKYIRQILYGRWVEEENIKLSDTKYPF